MRQISETIRINYQGNAMQEAYDVKVEQLINGEWKMVRGYNSMSDDYAFTNAKEYAQDLAITSRLTVK